MEPYLCQTKLETFHILDILFYLNFNFVKKYRGGCGGSRLPTYFHSLGNAVRKLLQKKYFKFMEVYRRRICVIVIRTYDLNAISTGSASCERLPCMASAWSFCQLRTFMRLNSQYQYQYMVLPLTIHTHTYTIVKWSWWYGGLW